MAARRRLIRGKHVELVSSANTSVSNHSFSPASFLSDAQIHRPIESFVDAPSEDGRRVYREVVPIEPPSPLKRARLAATSGSSGQDRLPPPQWDIPSGQDDRYEMFGDDGFDDPPLPPLPQARKPLFSVSWKQWQMQHLTEIKYRIQLCIIGRRTRVTNTCASFSAAMGVETRAKSCVQRARSRRAVPPIDVGSARAGSFCVGNVASHNIYPTPYMLSRYVVAVDSKKWMLKF
jgi:hypothetical protein